MALSDIFRKKPKELLGIDIGTSSIKIVELGLAGEQAQLRNYGEMKIPGYFERLRQMSRANVLQFLDSDIAKIIYDIMAEAGMSAKTAFMALPIYASFFTFLELPKMTSKELDAAVNFQAKKFVPIPVAEVMLEWEPIAEIAKDKQLILVIALSKEVIEKYIRIASLCNLELQGLEVETYGLIRSLIPQDEIHPIIIFDFGAHISSITVAEKGSIRMHHTLDVSSGELTRLISQGVGISLNRAEVFKIEQGLLGKGAEKEISKTMQAMLEVIFSQLDRVASEYSRKYAVAPTKIILAGAGSLLPGLAEELKERLEKEVEIANPFLRLITPPLLKPVLEEIGPAFAVAVGMALRK